MQIKAKTSTLQFFLIYTSLLQSNQIPIDFFVVFLFSVLLKKVNILKKSPGTNHCLPDENNFISLAEKAFYYDHIPL